MPAQPSKNEKNGEDKGMTSQLKELLLKIKAAWEMIKSKVGMKHIKFRQLLVLALLFLFKRQIYDKFRAISYVEQQIKEEKYRKLMIGNLLVIAYPTLEKSMFNYHISSMAPKTDVDLYKLAEASKIKNIISMFPTET